MALLRRCYAKLHLVIEGKSAVGRAFGRFCQHCPSAPLASKTGEFIAWYKMDITDQIRFIRSRVLAQRAG